MIFLGHLTAFVCKFTTKVVNLCCEVVKLLKKFVMRQRLKRKQEGGDDIENETNAQYDDDMRRIRSCESETTIFS